MKRLQTLPMLLLLTVMLAFPATTIRAATINCRSIQEQQEAGQKEAEAPAASDEKPAEEKTEDEKPSTIKAKTAPILAVETLVTRAESQTSHEIRIDMDQWTELEVDEVVSQGATVKSGQVLLKFDTEKFDEKLAESRLDMQLAELERALAEAANDYAERTWEMDRERAETDWAETRDDIQFWMDVRKQMSIESAKRSLENSEHSVEYAQEELDQLEKMYDEDELTEESEKIVLERTQRELEDSQFWLKRNRIETDRELSVEIPRMEQQQQRQLRRGELDYNKAMIDLPAARKRREIEYEKSRLTHEKAVEEFEKLNTDREKMAIRAPADGVLYHGEFDRGTWTNSSGSKLRSIQPDDKLGNDVVVMTIVDPARLQLRCDMTEAQAAQVRAGTTAHVTSPALPGVRFNATVQSVSPFPVDGETYDCVLSLGEKPDGLRPGMTCEAKLVVYEQPRAVVVPSASVFTDNDGISHYVFLWNDNKPERREVVTGREHDSHTEILGGLNAGDEILESRPDNK